MTCVRSVSYSCTLNREITGYFKQDKRHMIGQSIVTVAVYFMLWGIILPITRGGDIITYSWIQDLSRCPLFSYLFFVDDFLIFYKGT